MAENAKVWSIGKLVGVCCGIVALALALTLGLSALTLPRSVHVDEDGLCSTTLIREPIDQAALIGMCNHLNGLGLPVVSVECLAEHWVAGPCRRSDA